MKVNGNDFKHLPNGQQYIEVLEALFQMKQGESPYPQYEKLLQLISQSVMGHSVPVVFPYMVALSVERGDLVFVNFLCNLKLGFYHQGDLSRQNPAVLREYLAGLHNVGQKFPLAGPSNLSELTGDFTSFFLWNSAIFRCFSHEILAFSSKQRFETAFKVECPHCGNDIHSLYINGKEPEKTEGITPAAAPGAWDGLFWDDLYTAMSHCGKNLNEEYYTKILPYVYGTYRCTVCEKESVVMDAMLAKDRSDRPGFLYEDRFLQQLEVLLFQMQIPAEAWEMCRFLVAQYRNRDGLHSAKAFLLLLRTTQVFLKRFPAEMKELIYQNCAKELAEIDPECQEMGRIYQYYAVLLEQQGQVAEAESYFQKSFPLVTKVYGEESLELLGAEEMYAFFQSRQREQDKELPLLPIYEKMKKIENKNKIRVQMFRFALKDCYRNEKKYPEAVAVMKELVAAETKEHLKHEYQYFLGEALAESGAEEEAKAQLHQSYVAHLNMMAMPENWKTLGKKERKTFRISPKTLQFASQTAFYLGRLQDKSGDEGIKWTQECIALQELMGERGTVMKGDAYHYLAKCYEVQQDGKQEKRYLEKAKTVYEVLAKLPQATDPLRERLAEVTEKLQSM